MPDNPFTIKIVPGVTLDGIDDLLLRDIPENDPRLTLRQYFNQRLFFAESDASRLADLDPVPLGVFLKGLVQRCLGPCGDAAGRHAYVDFDPFGKIQGLAIPLAYLL